MIAQNTRDLTNHSPPTSKGECQFEQVSALWEELLILAFRLLHWQNRWAALTKAQWKFCCWKSMSCPWAMISSYVSHSEKLLFSCLFIQHQRRHIQSLLQLPKAVVKFSEQYAYPSAQVSDMIPFCDCKIVVMDPVSLGMSVCRHFFLSFFRSFFLSFHFTSHAAFPRRANFPIRSLTE